MRQWKPLDIVVRPWTCRRHVCQGGIKSDAYVFSTASYVLTYSHVCIFYWKEREWINMTIVPMDIKTIKIKDSFKNRSQKLNGAGLDKIHWEMEAVACLTYIYLEFLLWARLNNAWYIHYRIELFVSRYPIVMWHNVMTDWPRNDQIS